MIDSKILFLLNVYIVDSKDDIEFKKLLKTIGSYTDFAMMKAILNIELQSFQDSKWKKLEELCSEVFNNFELSKTRICRQSDWLELLGSKDLYSYVVFICNHDHVSLGHVGPHLKEYINIDDGKYETTLALSHWPEVINSAGSKGIPYKHGFIYEGQNVDSIQVIPRALLIKWFEPAHLQSIWLPRTDPPFSVTGKNTSVTSIEEQKIYVPYKEILAHIDGYTHFKPGILLNDAPKIALEVPLNARYMKGDSNLVDDKRNYSRFLNIIYSYYMFWPSYSFVCMLTNYNDWEDLSKPEHISRGMFALPLRLFRISMKFIFPILKSL